MPKQLTGDQSPLLQLDLSQLAVSCGAVHYSPPPMRAVAGYSFTHAQLTQFVQLVLSQSAAISNVDARALCAHSIIQKALEHHAASWLFNDEDLFEKAKVASAVDALSILTEAMSYASSRWLVLAQDLYEQATACLSAGDVPAQYDPV